MNGQDFQTRLDRIVEDLQTDGKGKRVNIAFRSGNGELTVLPLSSDADGVVNAAELNEIQSGWINSFKPAADEYEGQRVIYEPYLEAYKTARSAHQALIDAAHDAGIALRDALEADAGYQTAKTALEGARQDPDYVAAVQAYKEMNISENYGNLQESRGKYDTAAH